MFGAFELVNQGAFAEYGVIDENFISHKPENLTFIEAASVPLAGLTAWQGLFEILELQPGQKILIQAAAGGVGVFATQLAKLRGAHVVAIGSEKNFSFLHELGADEVIDYHKGYAELSNDYDAIFDSMETSALLIPHLKKGGRYLSITEAASQELAQQYEIKAFNFLYQPNTAQLNQVKELIEKNKLKVFVDKVLPLADAAEILKYQMEGHSKGKNVLEVF
ncbi:NADP-dependent oxidoreductase [Chryseobacterium sp. T20]|uniref:NADP-dependent oxidoreductase n=1 Tax=Chryseobacterium sp. T20 TaxID=3395375 RepID=UPI0039BD4952